jgi:hypothetical protein
MAGMESTCLGQYNSSAQNRRLMQDMIKVAENPRTLVVIIADECHWGAGAPAAHARAGLTAHAHAGAGAGSCGTEEPDNAKGSGSERSAANHEVRAPLPFKICISSVELVLAAWKHKWLLKYVSHFEMCLLLCAMSSAP